MCVRVLQEPKPDNEVEKIEIKKGILFINIEIYKRSSRFKHKHENVPKLEIILI